MNKRVYLSKSNSCNLDELLLVREILKRLNVSVYEFEGGTYSPDPIRHSDYLLVLPHTLGKYNLGRGQYEQIDYALRHHVMVLFIDSIAPEDGVWRLSVVEVDDVEEEMSSERNWTRNWGYVNVLFYDPIDIINYEGFSYKPGMSMPTEKELRGKVNIKSVGHLDPGEIAGEISKSLHDAADSFEKIEKSPNPSTVRVHLAAIRLLKHSKYGK